MNKCVLIKENGEVTLVNTAKEATQIAGEDKAILYVLNPILTFGYNKASNKPEPKPEPIESKKEEVSVPKKQARAKKQAKK